MQSRPAPGASLAPASRGAQGGRGRHDDPDVERALVFLTDLTIRLSALANEIVGRGGLSNNDVRVVLRIRDLGHPTPGELAQRIGVARSEVSRSLRSLTAQGIVLRRTKPNDRRSYSLSITREGGRRLDAVADAWMTHLAHIAAGALDVAGMLDSQSDARRDEVQPVDAFEAIDGLVAAGAAYGVAVQVPAQHFGITSSSMRFALTYIASADVTRPAELAKRLNMTASGASGVLDRLESAGLITRKGQAADGRAVSLAVTPRGKLAAEQLREPLAAHANLFATALTQAIAMTGRAAALTPPVDPPTSR